jgi:glycosyltransferase involved in cell wall biosynthesis
VTRSYQTLKYIYWFSYYNLSSPSVRYRALYPLERLKEKEGIGYVLICPGYRFTTIARFAAAFFSALFFRKKNSLIVFQKIYSRGLYATALKLLLFFRRENTLYDIDDAEYVKYPPSTIRHFMRYSSACSAGSKSLCDYALNLNRRTFVLTSPVIFHGKIKKERNYVPTIGWVGFYTAHRESLLRLFFPALIGLDLNVKLVLMGVTRKEHREEIRQYFASQSNVSVEIPREIDWMDESAVYERIAEFDIGVSPLLDTEINRAKSAFKLKQYLSCGVPALASRTGENSFFLNEGKAGFFCEGPDDFKKRIRQLYSTNEDEYRTFSFNAFISSALFSLDAYCETLVRYYREKSLLPARSPVRE